MSALPFRGPAKDGPPGDRVVVHNTKRGDIQGEVMYCLATGPNQWNVFVLEDGRQTIWQAPLKDVERVSGEGPTGEKTVSGSSSTPSSSGVEGHRIPSPGTPNVGALA